tara:strand:+ start:260 stop:586 length:327 start_codon:yes stop_codon:yes gene_type:complete
MKQRCCDELNELTHTFQVVIQNSKGVSHVGIIHFDADRHWHYARINIYLEMSKKFWSSQKLKSKIPYVQIPCENCEVVKNQMRCLQGNEIDREFRNALITDLMRQVND